MRIIEAARGEARWVKRHPVETALIAGSITIETVVLPPIGDAILGGGSVAQNEQNQAKDIEVFNADGARVIRFSNSGLSYSRERGEISDPEGEIVKEQVNAFGGEADVHEVVLEGKTIAVVIRLKSP